MLLLKSKQLGNEDADLSDFWTGHARRGIRSAPYSDAVMAGIELAQQRRLLGQAHLDLLGADTLMRHWLKSGFVKKGAKSRGR